jgi:hypothetical protein
MSEPANGKKSPPLAGLAVAAILWFWGALFLFGPSYVGHRGGWQILTNVAGFGLVVVGFASALIEFARLKRSEALEYWGASAVFLLPALMMHLSIELGWISNGFWRAGRISVLCLLAIGVPLLLQGTVYLAAFSREPRESIAATADQRADDLKVWASLLIALLSVTAAALKVVIELGG